MAATSYSKGVRKKNTGYRSFTEGAEVANPHARPVSTKIKTSSSVKCSPIRCASEAAGTSPSKPPPMVTGSLVACAKPAGAAEENTFGVREGGKLVRPIQECSLARCGKRERKSAVPFPVPLRYSRVGVVIPVEKLLPTLYSWVVFAHLLDIFLSFMIRKNVLFFDHK